MFVLRRLFKLAAVLKELIMAPDDKRAPLEYPTDKARGGEIILRRRWHRVVFVAGLIGFVVLALLFNIFALSGS